MAKRLFVVDDDPPIVGFLAGLGKSCGFEIESSTTGHQLSERIAQFQPAFLILDLVMPEHDGIEILREMADAEVKAKILLISGFNPDLLSRAKALGRAWQLNVIEIMEKPLDAEKVLACMNAIVAD